MQTAEKSIATLEALKQKIKSRTARVGIVGLGYVGLPLAVEFAKAGFSVTGIDVLQPKVDGLNRGESHVQDVPSARDREVCRARSNSAPPPTSPSCASSTPSTSASPRRCARPKIRT